MDFCKHINALNTVHFFLYGFLPEGASYKVASMFYYQNYETRAYEQLEAYQMSRNIAVQCDDPQCIQELDTEITRLNQLIASIDDGDEICH